MNTVTTKMNHHQDNLLTNVLPMKSLLNSLLLAACFVMPLLAFPAWAQFGGWGVQRDNGTARFQWQGEVDDTAYIRIQGRRANTQHANGLPVQRQRYDFTDPLPRANVNLDLRVLEGRGRVRLVEEPNRRNDYTAVVRIEDERGGSDNYRFELRWDDRTVRDNSGWGNDNRGWNDRRGNDNRDWNDNRGYGNGARGDVFWSGTVDGETIIRVQGNRAWTERRTGQGSWNERVQFSGGVPSLPQFATLVNQRGRGDVTVIEQPSRRNNYTTSVLVRDEQSGASSYQFTLRLEGDGRGDGWQNGNRGWGNGRWN